MKKKIIIIIIGILIIGGGIFGWQFLSSSKQAVFQSTNYGFEIKYPKNWTIKEQTSVDKYRLDIYYPESIDEAKTYGNVVVEFFIREDNGERFKTFFNQLKLTPAMIEDIVVGNIKGFRGVEEMEISGGKSVATTYLFSDKGCRLLSWSIDSGGEKYKDKVEKILSTFKFLN
jgi:hypothetical protein